MKLLHASLMSVYFFFLTNATPALAFNPFPPAKILYELSDQRFCNDEKRTQKILEKYKGRVSQQSSGVIYSWLSTGLEFRGSSYSPLVLLGRNAYAISWFLDRAFDATERNSGNERIVQLVRNALKNDLVSPQNTFINNLLQNSFSTTSSTLLTEVLLSIVTGDPEFGYVNIDYQSLIQSALTNRNYHLISDYIFNAEGVRNDSRSYHLIILNLICREHSIWESITEPEPEIEWDLGCVRRDDDRPGMSNIYADQQSTASASTSTSRFGRFLNWLSEEVDTYTLNRAIKIATESQNHRAISWLSARVKANDNVNQDSPQADVTEEEINIVANHDFTVIDLTEPDGTSTQCELSTPDRTYFTNPNYNANTTPSGHQVDQPEQGYFRWLAGLFCFNFIYSRK